MARRKIVMEFPLHGDPQLVDTKGFGKSCEAHIEEVAKQAGADLSLVCPLPDLEKEPEHEQREDIHVRDGNSQDGIA